MTFTQLLLILRARIRTVLMVFVLAVTGALAVSLLLPKKYTATASIVLDVRGPDPILGAIAPGMVNTGYMSTQVDILMSNKVAMQVVKDLELDQNPTAREKYMEATDGQGPIELWLAKGLQLYLEVKPARDSNVLDISYTSVDPKFAAIVANALAKAYIETNLAMRVEPARQYATWFDGQIKTLRDNLEKAQTNLSDFQRKAGIVATDERLDVENARLAELSTQLVALQGQSADSRSRQNQARDSTETMPEVLSHPLIQGLKGDVARLEAKLQDTRAQLGKNHPGVERAEAELRSLREKLDVEMRKVISGITTANQVNQEREVEIRRSLNAQRGKGHGDEGPPRRAGGAGARGGERTARLRRGVEPADADEPREPDQPDECLPAQSGSRTEHPLPATHPPQRRGLGRRGFDAGPRAGPSERAPRSASSVRTGFDGSVAGARPRQHRSGHAQAGRPQAVRPQAAAASVAGVGTTTLGSHSCR